MRIDGDDEVDGGKVDSGDKEDDDSKVSRGVLWKNVALSGEASRWTKTTMRRSSKLFGGLHGDEPAPAFRPSASSASGEGSRYKPIVFVQGEQKLFQEQDSVPSRPIEVDGNFDEENAVAAEDEQEEDPFAHGFDFDAA